MERLRSRDRLLIRAATVVLSGSLALAACSTGDDRPETAPPPPDTGTTPTTGQTEGQLPTLVFDYLGVGSTIIRVFPGVTETRRDTRHNGTYNDGDRVTAICETEGRLVQATSSTGEDHSSTTWYLIHGSPGETQYASAAFAENPEQLSAATPDC